MTDSDAMQQIETGLRALFDNFVRRSIQAQPEVSDNLKAVAGEVLSGAHGLIFQVEVTPVVGISLACGIAPNRDIGGLVRIFDGHPAGIIQHGQTPWQ